MLGTTRVLQPMKLALPLSLCHLLMQVSQFTEVANVKTVAVMNLFYQLESHSFFKISVLNNFLIRQHMLVCIVHYSSAAFELNQSLNNIQSELCNRLEASVTTCCPV